MPDPTAAAGPEPIRLLLVDDHPVVRDGLRGIFDGEPEFQVVGEASDGSEALTRVRSLKPDVVLMDLRMPGTDGLTAIRALSRTSRCHVLVLTTYDTDQDVVPAIDAGATGYLLKDAPREDLYRAVRAAAQGQTVMSPTVASQVLGRVREPDPRPEELTRRELQVLRMVAGGANNREIAGHLFISETTVKTHLLNVYDKFGVRDRAAAVAVAYERGLSLLEDGR